MVSQVSMVNSRTPTPITSTSPIIRAINSAEGVLFNRSIGQAMTPRKSSLRTFARIQPLAVISHHRFNIRGISVANVPPANASAAQPTEAGPTSPRSKANAVSMARPSNKAGNTTAVFMMMPIIEPTTICPDIWRK